VGNSVDANGNCTESFVNDFNRVVHASQDAADAVDDAHRTYDEKRQVVQGLQNACQNFYSAHGNVSCNAAVNGDSQNVSGDKIKGACDAADRYLAQPRPAPAPAPAPTPAPNYPNLPAPSPTPTNPTPGGDNTVVGNLNPEQIKATLTDAGTYKRMAKDQTIFMANGRTGDINSFKDEVLNGGTVCFAFTLSQDKSVVDGLKNRDAFTATAKEEKTGDHGERQLVILFDKASAGFGCVKMNANPFTMGEVRTGTRGILDFSATR
jgi:hypothetical protein